MKKYLLILCAVKLFFLESFAAEASLGSFESQASAVYIIDAGHGGADGGAVGIDGVMEKDINLAISEKTALLLPLMGLDAVTTRDRDISIHDPGVTGIRNQKISDLKNRVNMASGYTNPVYISVHLNLFPVEKYRGAQVFYSTNHPDSKILADVLQNNARVFLDGENKRVPKAAKDVYIMERICCPAVIFECGFISNPIDAALLQTGEYQLKCALAILASCIELSTYES